MAGSCDTIDACAVWSRDYIRTGRGQLIATENAAGGVCATCYFTVDHLGGTQMVTDSLANVKARHDYLPFGEEIAASTAGRDSNFGFVNDVTLKFTGQMRDQEAGQDFFNARYFTPALGRFNSPDPRNAGASLLSSQSWNGYSYTLGNPLRFVDPTGLYCWSVDDNGNTSWYTTVDQGGCISAGGNWVDGFGADGAASGNASATVTAPNPSDLEYWFTISTNQIPAYNPNAVDVPLNDNANAIIKSVGKTLAGVPDACSLGVFVYAGAEAEKEESSANGFVGYLGSYDTQAGGSNNLLLDGGNDSAGGGGALGRNSVEGLVFLPAFAGGKAGFVAGFSNEGLSFGLYGGGPLRKGTVAPAVGVGVYATISTMGGCQRRQQGH